MKSNFLLPGLALIGIIALSAFWLRPVSDNKPMPETPTAANTTRQSDEEFSTEEQEAMALLTEIGYSQEAVEKMARGVLKILEDIAEDPDADLDEYARMLVELSPSTDDFLRQFSGSTALKTADLPKIGDLHPYTYAENLYQTKWQGFIDELGLSTYDTGIVRDLIVAHQAYNTELMDQVSNGQIDKMSYGEARKTLDDLRQDLTQYLSPEQLDALVVADRQYRDFSRQYRNEQLRESEEQGYMSGIVFDASNGDLEAVMTGIRAGVDVNTTTTDGRWSALHEAAYNGDADIVQELLEAGADVNWVSSNDRSALTRAAEAGHTELLHLLVDAGANLEHHAPDDSMHTTLARTAREGHTDTIKELLRLGADATGEAGRMALYYAIGDGNREIERMLREARE